LLLWASTGLPAVSRRLVVTSPAVTETLFQLGLGADVVGTVEWSDYPAEARAVPRVGPLAFPGLEAIVRKRPSLVVVDVTQPGPDWTVPLARSRIPVFRWKPVDVGAFFASTAALLDAASAPPEAQERLARWRSSWSDTVSRCRRARPGRERVLLLASTDPAIAFGTDTFLVDAFRALGFEPVLPGRLGGFASVGPDWMRASALDRALWIDFHGPSPERELRRFVGPGPRLEALDADAFSRPGWTALRALSSRFCDEVPDA
jgi:ABC-type Fe3+-hydroxamate transport system substrate-binding protein